MQSTTRYVLLNRVEIGRLDRPELRMLNRQLRLEMPIGAGIQFPIRPAGLKFIPILVQHRADQTELPAPPRAGCEPECPPEPAIIFRSPPAS